jgi:predicted HTH transcriptional regulator
LILKENAPLFYRDLKALTQRFPTCGLVHKSARLEAMIKIKERGWRRKPRGVTKRRLIDLLQNPMTSQELSSQLNIPASSIREHLLQLQAAGKVRRLGKKNKRSIVWASAKLADFGLGSN